MTQWEESKHPRDEGGKFTSGGGGTPAEHKRLKELGIETKEAIAKSLSYKEKQSIIKYFSSDSYFINDKLYNNKELSLQDKEFVNAFDSALKKMPFVKSQTLVRDMLFAFEEEVSDYLKNIKVGIIIENAAYWSATKNTEYQEMPDIRYIIKNANKARDMEKYEDKEENEAIYERNSKFKVNSIKTIKKYGIYDILEIEVEEV